MERMTFRMTASKKHRLDTIAETEKLKNYTEVFRFLVEGYFKKANEAPKVKEKKPTPIPIWNDPKTKSAQKKILKLLKVMNRSIKDTEARTQITRLLPE